MRSGEAREDIQLGLKSEWTSGDRLIGTGSENRAPGLDTHVQAHSYTQAQGRGRNAARFMKV